MSRADTPSRAEGRRRRLSVVALRVLLGAVAALAGTAVAAEQTTAAAAAAENYLLHCSGCHMDDGAGSARNDVPDMRRSIGHFVRSAAGRAYLAQVAGVAQSPIDDAALATLLNWLLPTFSAAELPPDFMPYSATEITRLRHARPADLDGQRTRIAGELRARGHAVADY